MDDFSQWPTKQDAAQRLHCTTRNIERHVEAGRIRTEHRRVPGRKPITICHPDDIAKLESELVAIKPVPIPAKPQKAKPEFLSLAELSHKIFLDLDEAHRLSGLPKPLLVALCQQRRIMSIKRGKWLISRESLQSLGSPSSISTCRVSRLRRQHAEP